jgi:hypothetical protein
VLSGKTAVKGGQLCAIEDIRSVYTGILFAEVMMRKPPLAILGLLVLLPITAIAQITVKNEDVTFKFGVLGQIWGDWTQDSTGSQGYQQNFYLRRARFVMGGDIGKDISFFVETDDPKLGITPKNLSAGFIMQDALLEWHPTKAFQVVGGLMIVPFCRNGLQSAGSILTLDTSSFSAMASSATQSSGMRDVGFEAKGFFFKDRLLYRVGEYAGQRDANGHNSPRTAAYLQYDFFSPEKGYLFAGTSLGKQKVLAVSTGFDTQGAYRANSADVAATLPVNGGDEIAAQFQFTHYDGRTKFLTIPDQNDYMFETGYYLHKAKTQAFLKAESQKFVAAANTPKDCNRFGAGANYYIRGQNLKWTVQYLRALPRNTTSLKPSNEFSMQLQLMYW